MGARSERTSMAETADARRVREILAAVRPLAAEYYPLTGKPLGVTGEVAEYVAAELLGLDARARNCSRRNTRRTLRRAMGGCEWFGLQSTRLGPALAAIAVGHGRCVVERRSRPPRGPSRGFFLPESPCGHYSREVSSFEALNCHCRPQDERQP